MEQFANDIELLRWQQREVLAQALACRIAMALWRALDHKPQAYLMLSGGSTPGLMLQALRCQPLPWARIEISLADERWVPADHRDSNTRTVKNLLLQDAAAAAQWHDLYTGDATVEAGVQRLEGEAWTGQAPDVLVLGMGNDGHTASLFPDVPELDHWAGSDAPGALLAVHTRASPLPRVSFSGRVLQRAGETLLHIHGRDKLDVLHRAQPQRYPIAAFLSRAQVWWAP